MTAYTDFHYSPTGSGVISGAQVLEQTEQGINGLGQYVQDNVSGAIDTANEALTTARNADSNATTAINLANSLNAQIIAANQTAGNALTTAQSAQNTANAASSLATTANNNATTALNTANAASTGVTTLTGTVNSLGNRMTAAENAINTNAGNITTLQNNLATTNANVTAAANAASSAQATATSAQSTATLARNQAYVLRYTGTTITGSGTIAYADIDNTDNIKAGDKIIDISGAIYDIASVDTANQTVTVGASPVINLFCDAENLIPAVTDTYDLGSSSYQWNNLYAKNYFYNGTAWGLDKANTWTQNNRIQAFLEMQYLSSGGYSDIRWHDENNANCCTFRQSANFLTIGKKYTGKSSWYDGAQILITASGAVIFKGYDGANTQSAAFTYDSFYPEQNNAINLGTSTNKWKSLNGINPGALSLPSENTESFNGDLTNKTGTTSNPKTWAINGWCYIFIANVAGDFISVVANSVKETYLTTGTGTGNGSIGVSFPIVAGRTYYIYVKASGDVTAYYVPTLGNV